MYYKAFTPVLYAIFFPLSFCPTVANSPLAITLHNILTKYIKWVTTSWTQYAIT